MYVSLLLVLSQLVGPISCGSHQLVRGRKHTPVRASTLMVLNNYIAIISTTKYQNVPYNGGAKAIFFGSIATVHSYFWLYTVAKRFYIYIYIYYLYVHIAFDYFTNLYSFFYSYFSSSSLPLHLLLSSSRPIYTSPAATDPSPSTHASIGHCIIRAWDCGFLCIIFGFLGPLFSIPSTHKVTGQYFPLLKFCHYLSFITFAL